MHDVRVIWKQQLFFNNVLKMSQNKSVLGTTHWPQGLFLSVYFFLQYDLYSTHQYTQTSVTSEDCPIHTVVGPETDLAVIELQLFSFFFATTMEGQ